MFPSITHSIRSNTVENPSPHIVLIQSPVKSSITKIIYAVDLIHVMLSRSILAVFIKCKIICLRGYNA